MRNRTLTWSFPALLLCLVSVQAGQQQEEQEDYFQKWLKEDVVYIISAEEKDVFQKLSTDEERERFIEQFWTARDPNPNTIINEFREEHYRRVQYANEKFFSGIRGWRTDRGRIYIKFGPPDEIQAHSSGGNYARPFWEGGGHTSTYPFEVWRYRHIEGVGDDVELEFVDDTLSGEYRLTTNPNDKDALLYAGGAGATMLEQMGLTSKVDRVRNLTNPVAGHNPYVFGRGRLKDQPFEKILLLTNLERPTKLGTPKLREFVKTKVRYETLPFHLRTDFVRIDEENYLVLLTAKIPNSELQFTGKGEVFRTVVNVYAEFVDVTGAVVTSFEEVVANEVPQRELSEEMRRYSLYQKSVQLRPGRYKLQIAVGDEVSEKLGTAIHLVVVPRIGDDQVATSSIVPALRIESLDEPDPGQFAMGPIRVFPNPESKVKKDQDLPLYFQIYNLAVDQTTGSPMVDLQYVISGEGVEVAREREELRELQGSTVSVVKFLPLEGLGPGSYSLELNIRDAIGNRTIKRQVPFTIVSG